VSELRRLTSEYVEFEDRIRLTGEGEDGQRVILWLTRRLLDRLVPYLVDWLERKGRAPLNERPSQASTAREGAIQRFAQEAVKASVRPEPPVQANLAERSWLVRSVDLAANSGVLSLKFKGFLEIEQVRFSPGEGVLRQWLGVLHGLYGRAGWPQAVWPGWVGAPMPGLLGERMMH
jgi:hypothetical protein